MAEKRGLLIDQSTGQQELLVLRHDCLRIFEATARQRHSGPPLRVLLSQPCEVRTLPGGVLEIRPRRPRDARYAFQAKTEAEARSWQEDLQKSISSEKERSKGFLQSLAQGNTAYKYNYSNSKRMRRHFWIDEARAELCWGKSRSEAEPQTMELKECMGIIYGPMTSTFLRCPSIEDSPWCCFSLLFQDRTLDMAVPGEFIDAWCRGLQRLLLDKGAACQTGLSEAEFVFRKVFLKLRDAAHRQGLTARTMLVRRLRALGQNLVPQNGVAKDRQSAAHGGGKASGPTTVATPAKAGSVDPLAEAEAEAKAERRRKRAERKAAEAKAEAGGSSSVPASEPSTTRPSTSSRRASAHSGLDTKDTKKVEARSPSNSHVGPSAEQEDVLNKTILDLEKQLEAATGELERLRPQWDSELGGKMPMEKLKEVLRCDGVSWQAEKCSELEKEVLGLRLASSSMQGQRAAAEKSEKQLKKLAKQIKDSETRVQSLEQELGSVQAGAQSSEQAKNSTAASLERTEAQTSHLERRVQELEQQLQQAKKGEELVVLQQQNQKQAEELSRLEAAKTELARELEAMQRDLKATEARRKENEQKLASCEGLSINLVGSLRRLQQEVGTLQAQHKQVKAEAETGLRSTVDEFPALSGAVQKIRASHDNLMARYHELAQERKKLHNLVLELKGNIRVFVRVRPMNEKEKQAEPAGEPTITFAEDCKVSVYEASQGRRKWFEFDKAFVPKCSQQEVFEEVKPLATSVLDGYNVCIFAYGQTGSGKTFTMNGNAENPGLNVRVLKELFREREERQVDMDIRISLMITEIYNETIKDLFVTKQKKLDVKQNPDGSNSVPGLTELPVVSVEDVMKAMKEAQSNRTVMATDMNEESSRSHSIVQVKTVNVSKKDKREYIGKINLIDLAGSENVNKSGVSGQGMREAQNINKSLSALGDVIGSLVAKTPHVPYRNSKLTMMLKDSLGGDSKTLMIVQSSPAQMNVTETLSSLNFASRARNVELGKAKRNVKGGE